MVKCEICLGEYQEGNIELHLRSCVLRLIFRCSICSEDYVSREGLWNHLDLHEIVDDSKELHCQELKAKHKLHQCALCNDQRCYMESSYQMHIRNFHDSCENQHQTVAPESNVWIEEPVSMKVEHLTPDDEHPKQPRGKQGNKLALEAGEKTYPCSFCKRHFASSGTLWWHKVASHTAPQKECSYCKKKLHFPYMVRRHEKACSKLRCHKCGIRFATHSKLNAHNISEHSHDVEPIKLSEAVDQEEGIRFEDNYNEDKKEITIEHHDRVEQQGRSIATTSMTCPKKPKEHDDYQFSSADSSLISGGMELQTNKQTVPHAENIELKLDFKVEDTVIQDYVSTDEHRRSATTSQGSAPTNGKVQAATSIQNGIKAMEKRQEKEAEVSTKCQNKVESSECRVECSICGLSFRSKGSLQYHKTILHKDPRFECSICKRKFFFTTHLHNHQKTCSSLRCHRCDIKFRNRNQLDFHNVEKHRKENTSDHVIDESVASLGHGITVKEECVEIEEENNVVLQTAPQSSKVKRSFTCKVCGINFATQDKLRYHRVVNHTVPKYECPFCQKKCYFGFDFRQHKKACSELRCHKCDIRFINHKRLRRHNIEQHSQVCKPKNEEHQPEDGKVASNHRIRTRFPKPPNIKYEPSVLNEVGEVVWPCSYCKLTFSRSFKRYEHQIKYHTEPRFACSICQKAFHFHPKLRKHEKGCSELRCYKCDIKFRHRSLLHKHNIEKHPEDSKSVDIEATDAKTSVTGMDDKNRKGGWKSLECTNKPLVRKKPVNKTFPCLTCGRTFTYGRSLWTHKVIQHTKPEQQCSFCKRMFHFPAQLARHKKSCIKRRCHQCDKVLATPSLLKMHKLTKHSSKNPSEYIKAEASSGFEHGIEANAELLQNIAPESCIVQSRSLILREEGTENDCPRAGRSAETLEEKGLLSTEKDSENFESAVNLRLNVPTDEVIKQERSEDFSMNEEDEGNDETAECAMVETGQSSSFLSPVHFRNLLRRTVYGKQLLEEAEQHKLSSNGQKLVVDTVARFHLESGQKTTEELINYLSDVITCVFSKESKDTYYLPRGSKSHAGGKIFSRINYIKQSERERAKHGKEHNVSITGEDIESQGLTAEVEAAVQWLALNTTPWTKVLALWDVSYQARKSNLKQCGRSQKLFDEYPGLRENLGYQLLDIDFRKLGLERPEEPSRKWEALFEPIACYASKHGKDSSTKRLIEGLRNSSYSTDVHLLQLLHLLSTVLIPVKVSKGFKPTVAAAQSDTILLASSIELGRIKLQKTLEIYHKQKIPVAPKLIVIGEALEAVSGVCIVAYKDVEYQLPTIAEGVDVLLKLQIVLGLPVSRLSKLVWIFIEKLVYNSEPSQGTYLDVNKLVEFLQNQPQ